MRKLLIAAARGRGRLGRGGGQCDDIQGRDRRFPADLVGNHDADLDIRSFTVNFDAAASVFDVAASFVGKIDTEQVGSYVLGVDTGKGQELRQYQ